VDLSSPGQSWGKELSLVNTQVFIRLILGVVFGLVGFYLAGLFSILLKKV